MHSNLDTDLEAKYLQELHSRHYDFVDLGCGTGESIAFCENHFKRSPGIGFDIAGYKIEGARENKFPAILADVTKTNFPDGCVSFCTMMDFLEHLYTQDDAHAILEAAGRLAKDFLFIRHPSFQDIEYLKEFGLKIDWTHWHGHRNMMLVEDFQTVFAELGWKEYCVVPQKQIFNSQHPAVVPLSAPIDSVRFDPSTMDKKEFVTFNRPVWTQFDIFVKLNPQMKQEEWQRIVSASSVEDRIIDLDGNLRNEVTKRRQAETLFREEKEKRLTAEAKYQEEKALRKELEEKFRDQKARREIAEQKFREEKVNRKLFQFGGKN